MQFKLSGNWKLPTDPTMLLFEHFSFIFLQFDLSFDRNTAAVKITRKCEFLSEDFQFYQKIMSEKSGKAGKPSLY
jgi:hypothetical protein